MSQAPAQPRAGSGSRFAAIVTYTLRSCLPPKRWAALLMACSGTLLFGLLAHVGDEGPDRAFAAVATHGILALTMPIAALVIGDAVLGAEIRAGTFHFTWLSPTPSWQIVAGRSLGGSLVALSTIVPAAALSATVATSPASIIPVAVAAGSGAIAYTAVFIAIGSITKRTAVWSLVFVFFIERLLGAALTGIAQLSPSWESQAVLYGLLEDAPRHLERTGIPLGGDAIVRLGIISAVALVVADVRMGRLRLSGAAD